MIRAINLCQDATLCGSTKMKPPFLHFDEPNLCNDYILRDPECINRFCIILPCHCVLNQVDLDTSLLDNTILTTVVLQPIKKPRSVGPHKSKLEKQQAKRNHASKTRNSGV